jgi:predicted ester cyclase
MSVQANKDLVTRYITEGNAAIRDVTKSLDIFDKYNGPKLINHLATGNINYEQTRQFGTAFFRAFPDFDETIDDIVAEGDKVVIRVTCRGTHKGEFLGISPTGKKVAYTGIAIHRISEGKIIESWGVVDMLSLMQQLGAIPRR